MRASRCSDAGPRPAGARLYRAILLRLQGATFRMIAVKLTATGHAPPSYTERHAWRDVVTALERQRCDRVETVEQARTLELERLDDLFAKLWPKAVAGDYMAFDRLLGLMGMRARLLGLYANSSAKAEVAVQDAEKTVTVQLAWGDGADDWQTHAPADPPSLSPGAPAA